jgi:hypothetical protein
MSPNQILAQILNVGEGEKRKQKITKTGKEISKTGKGFIDQKWRKRRS